MDFAGYVDMFWSILVAKTGLFKTTLRWCIWMMPTFWITCAAWCLGGLGIWDPKSTSQWDFSQSGHDFIGGPRVLLCKRVIQLPILEPPRQALRERWHLHLHGQCFVGCESLQEPVSSILSWGGLKTVVVVVVVVLGVLLYTCKMHGKRYGQQRYYFRNCWLIADAYI